MNELTLSPENKVGKTVDKLSVPATLDDSVGYYYIDLDKIFYLESRSNRTIIHKEKEDQITETEIEATKTLLYFEKVLRGKPFLRIHHSFIINAQKLAKYNKGARKFVTLINGDEIDVSRSRKDILENEIFGKYPVPVYEGIVYVDLKFILYLEADRDKTKFYFAGSPSITSTKNVGFFEDSLANRHFFRIHDKYIINLVKVVKNYRRSNSCYAVLDTGMGLPVSASKKEAFLEYFR